MTSQEVRELRRRLGMTQERFATAIGGVHYTTVSRWERGTTTPTPRDLTRLRELALGAAGTPASFAGRLRRAASVSRSTSETEVTVKLVLDGTGIFEGATGNGMLDHLLAQIARHGLLDLSVTTKADLSPGWHHLVEDVAIVLGRALREAVGEGRGIVRMGHAYAPLDETLAFVSLDLSGRPYAVVRTGLAEGTVGDLPADLVRHFLETFALEARAALHARVIEGVNPHHKAEALFKALARALRMAVTVDVRAAEQVPSTKGSVQG